MNPSYVKFHQAIDLGLRTGLTTYWSASIAECATWKARMNPNGVILEKDGKFIFIANSNVVFVKGDLDEAKTAKKTEKTEKTEK